MTRFPSLSLQQSTYTRCILYRVVRENRRASVRAGLRWSHASSEADSADLILLRRCDFTWARVAFSPSDSTLGVSSRREKPSARPLTLARLLSLSPRRTVIPISTSSSSMLLFPCKICNCCRMSFTIRVLIVHNYAFIKAYLIHLVSLEQ